MVRGGARSSLQDDEKTTLRELNNVPLKGHGLAFINESGLYKLILRSSKPPPTTLAVVVWSVFPKEHQRPDTHCAAIPCACHLPYGEE